MIRKTNTIKLTGLNGVPLNVECQISEGTGIHLVGLSDTATKESLLRTITAMNSKRYNVPGKKIIINLTPTNLYKKGAIYDLPIALTCIAASGQDNGRLANLEKVMVCGELGLDGCVRPIDGVIQVVAMAIKMELDAVIIPNLNTREVMDFFADQIDIYCVNDLEEAIDAVKASENKEKNEFHISNKITEEQRIQTETDRIHDEADNDNFDRYVNCYPALRRALAISAAGGHNLLFLGIDHTKTGIYSTFINSLRPELKRNETLTLAKLYSISGRGEQWRRFSGNYKNGIRPLRNPFSSVSLANICTDGDWKPGEISLANHGILLLDEIENMRSITDNDLFIQIMKEKKVTISDPHSGIISYPAEIQVVANTTPIPNTNSLPELMEWKEQIHVKLYDKMDLQLSEKIIHRAEDENQNISFDTLKESVKKAFDRQVDRFDGLGIEIRKNADITIPQIAVYAKMSSAAKDALEQAMGNSPFPFSEGACASVIRVARTIADMDDKDMISPEHIIEALSYRPTEMCQF